MTDTKKVDEDWKRQMQAEKDIASASDSPAGSKEAPPEYAGSIDFTSFLTMLATQAMVQLGAMANPMTGEATQDLEQAKVTIDTLDMLEVKTRGNLTEPEKAHLDQLLSDLRYAFVQSSQAPPQSGS